MVAQPIATVAFFAARSEGLVNHIVYVGGLTNVPSFRERLIEASEVFGGEVAIPQRSEYSTAYGAAIALQVEKAHKP
jgi:activator of 2-hydroxyglutaryl-CoA dehydratase